MTRRLLKGNGLLALDPGGAYAHEILCQQSVPGQDGRKEAIPMFQKAIRLNPYGPATTLFVMFGAALRSVRVDLRRRFRPIRRPSCGRLISSSLILVWPLPILRWVERRRPALKLPKPAGLIPNFPQWIPMQRH